MQNILAKHGGMDILYTGSITSCDPRDRRCYFPWIRPDLRRNVASARRIFGKRYRLAPDVPVTVTSRNRIRGMVCEHGWTDIALYVSGTTILYRCREQPLRCDDPAPRQDNRAQSILSGRNRSDEPPSDRPHIILRRSIAHHGLHSHPS